VAKGLPNKEIADALCLSVHTVATHRRNLSAKLDIHTPAGLTIFAILNNLVTLDEVKHLK
jgi:DNA-binding NarL/FixJ family response regulator